MKRLMFCLTLLTLLIAGTLGAYRIIEVPEAGAKMNVAVFGGSVPAASVSYIFEDNFELNNLNKWPDGNSGTMATAASPGWTNDMGSYCAKITAAGDDDWAMKAITAQTPFWATWFFGISNIDMGNQWEKVGIVEFFGDSENDYIYVYLQGSAADGTISQAGFGYNSSSLQVYGDFVPTANTWYQFKIQIVDETTDGTGICHLWYRIVGGSWIELGSGSTTLNFGAGFAGITNIRLGVVNGDKSTSPLIYYDNVQVAATDVW